MIVERMNRIVKAYIHEGLEKLEDPVVLAKQYIREVEEDMKRLETVIEKHHQLAKSLKNDWQLAKQFADRREEQAKIALEKGNEELARKALVSKNEALKQMERYERLREKNEVLLNERKKQLEQLREKYRHLRDRKIEWRLRVQAVKAHEQMKKMNETYRRKESYFDRIEDRVRELEWRYDERFSSNDEEAYSPEIEAELKRLKEEK